jgi:hypothetical protein
LSKGSRSYKAEKRRKELKRQEKKKKKLERKLAKSKAEEKQNTDADEAATQENQSD